MERGPIAWMQVSKDGTLAVSKQCLFGTCKTAVQELMQSWFPGQYHCLGWVKKARQVFVEGNDKEVLDHLLEILFRDKSYGEEIARKTFIAMFPFIQDKGALRSYQRQLSMAINS